MNPEPVRLQKRLNRAFNVTAPPFRESQPPTELRSRVRSVPHNTAQPQWESPVPKHRRKTSSGNNPGPFSTCFNHKENLRHVLHQGVIIGNLAALEKARQKWGVQSQKEKKRNIKRSLMRTTCRTGSLLKVFWIRVFLWDEFPTLCKKLLVNFEALAERGGEAFRKVSAA